MQDSITLTGSGGSPGGPTTSSTTSTTKKAARSFPPVDMEAHMGLRGVSAVWILLFHCFIHSTIKLNFQGRSLMPLFFSLSGFSLAVVYGSKPWVAVGPKWLGFLQGPVVGGEDEGGQYRPFQSLQFYWNRFARIIPTYWLCTLLATPLVFMGYNEYVSPAIFPQSLVVSVIPISTLFTIGKGYPIDTPGWFVCTLVVLYLLFPFLLTRAQRLTDRALLQSFAYLFWFQAITFVGSYFLMVHYGYGQQIAYSAGRNPISRVAVFQMGIHAGLLCLRHPTGPLPFPKALLGLLPTCQSYGDDHLAQSPPQQQQSWEKTSDGYSLYLLVLTLAISLVDITLWHYTGIHDYLQSEVWLTALVPFAQLTLMVSLTREGGTSLSYRALCTPFAKWLGEISAALYLVHQVLEVWVQYATHGFILLQWPKQDCNHITPGTAEHTACQAQWDHFNYMRTQHPWAIPICAVVAMVAATLIYYGFERPLHRAMRKDKFGSPSSSSSSSSKGAPRGDLAIGGGGDSTEICKKIELGAPLITPSISGEEDEESKTTREAEMV